MDSRGLAELWVRRERKEKSATEHVQGRTGWVPKCVFRCAWCLLGKPGGAPAGL
jgi:hypothetical protein